MILIKLVNMIESVTKRISELMSSLTAVKSEDCRGFLDIKEKSGNGLKQCSLACNSELSLESKNFRIHWKNDVNDHGINDFSSAKAIKEMTKNYNLLNVYVALHLNSFFFYVCVCHSVLFIYLFIYFPFIFISWRLITLQYCSGFCHTLT